MTKHGNKQDRDHSFKHSIGVMLQANAIITFNKLGFCIILKHQSKGTMNPKVSTYVIYSQNEQREWEIPCWVINQHYTKIADHVQR